MNWSLIRRLRCAGSSLFLKSRFGLGYTLTLSTGPGSCSATAVGAAVRSFVREAELLSQHAGELSFRLPFASTASFGPLLRHLAAAQAQLGLQSFGVSLASMEEVFLRLSSHPAAVNRRLARLDGGGLPPPLFTPCCCE